MDSAVFKPYAKAIISAIAIIMILAILAIVPFNGKTGLENIIGAGADFEDTDFSTYQDAAAMSSYAQLGLPEIEYNAVDIVAGTSVNMEDLFTVEGAGGAAATIYIEDITDHAEASILFASEEDKRKDVRLQATDAFVFPSQGIYTIYVKAVDENKKVSFMQCRVPVIN